MKLVTYQISQTKPLHEPLGPPPIIILIILFWNIKTLPVLVEVPQTIIPYLNSD